MHRRGLAIAGIRGGSGKTVISMGIARAMHRRGIAVAPFKKGPDYIDPGWLGAAAGRPCYNLDSYLFDERELVSSFLHSNASCTLAIMEGNRGLFDGVDADGTHSIAAIAKKLGLPIILVADCTKATRTIAALVHGCRTFDGGAPLEGVILNNVAGERHRRVTVRSVEEHAGVRVFGAVPRLSSVDLPERHLGLTTVYEHPDPDRLIDGIADRIEGSVDIDGILAMTGGYRYRELETAEAAEKSPARGPSPAVGVVFDRAFTFYYPETLEAMERLGARVVRIDALNDRRLPDVDALYIGGGFPENFAEGLSGNGSLRQDIRAAVEGDLPVYAECGGLIYLSEAIQKGDAAYPMVGVFPYRFSVSARPQAHGYVEFHADRENPYFERGVPARGHEFRYSRISNQGEIPPCDTVFAMDRGTGIMDGRDGVRRGMALATFCHTHPRSGVQWIRNLVRLAAERRAARG
ncbi:MAG: cobyrinate a,c-diamide synthase [Spirochaetes bacterium]|nr:cobyrinate a,c-diamide synthase [Spirochaetota bacterium]